MSLAPRESPTGPNGERHLNEIMTRKFDQNRSHPLCRSRAANIRSTYCYSSPFIVQEPNTTLYGMTAAVVVVGY